MVDELHAGRYIPACSWLGRYVFEAEDEDEAEDDSRVRTGIRFARMYEHKCRS